MYEHPPIIGGGGGGGEGSTKVPHCPPLPTPTQELCGFAEYFLSCFVVFQPKAEEAPGKENITLISSN